ncbi:MAG: arginine--tRNA ligase [Acidimicrobiia bacterium]|nr:arginine--tRNA ligase [Acidimicrobiia bacterium]MDH3396242.1 arginine--tRNA ligase [Acidimicrobiia bacterium]
MTLLNDLTRIFGDAFEQTGLDRALGTVVVSQRPDLGEFQCNGALPAAKTTGRPPREIAQDIVDRVQGDDRFAVLSLAGPGFINISLTDSFLAKAMQLVIDDPRVGVPEVRPRKVLVDYGGPNVAKEMHVGHLRATIIGDSLKRIARFLGHDTLGDAHFGDWGTQMGMLIVEIAHRNPELPFFDPAYTGQYPAIDITLDDLEAMYPLVSARCVEDPVEADRARIATFELQQGRSGYRALWQQLHDISMAAHRRDFASLGVEFDLWHGESTVHERIGPMIERLREAGVVTESEGAMVIAIDEPGDKTEMPPFLVAKSDGGFLYSTTDLATVEARVDELKREVLLYVVDARQSFHFDQVFRAARRGGIAPESVELEHIKFGTMNGPDGRPFQTRKGGVLKLHDLISMVTEAADQRLSEADIAQEYPETERIEIARQVGLGALKFGDLSNHRTSNYLFDLDRFASFEGKTGPYLQYSAVRIKSILRNAEEAGLSPGPLVPPGVDTERNLLLHLARLPEVLERTFELRAPNHVAEYAYDVATQFNRFYEECHILREEDPARQASWLALVDLTLRELHLLLDLLGIEVPEKM